jgi:DNA-binding CsgD family transcriptional regulator
MARVLQEEPSPALTERELAILRLLADGMSNRDIAAQLVLSVNTVKWHTQHLFDKLRVKRRTQAIAEARSLGLLGDSTQNPAGPVVPVPLTPLVGREQELADLTEWVASPDVRLVTIVGPGGIGKTRLALALAEHRQASTSQPAVFVRLESVAAPDQVVLALAGALSFQFGGPQTPTQQLLRYLRDADMLLILDNFEHVLDAAPLVTDMLRVSRKLKVMTTSRERLNLRGEIVFALEGLTYPADGTDLERFSAAADVCARGAPHPVPPGADREAT